MLVCDNCLVEKGKPHTEFCDKAQGNVTEAQCFNYTPNEPDPVDLSYLPPPVEPPPEDLPAE